MRVHEVRIVNVKLKRRWRPWPTDHALVRYMERVLGVPVTIDHIKQARAALTGSEVQLAILHGASAATVDGHKVVIEGNTVVTVLAPDMQEHDVKTAQKRRLARMLNTEEPTE